MRLTNTPGTVIVVGLACPAPGAHAAATWNYNHRNVPRKESAMPRKGQTPKTGEPAKPTRSTSPKRPSSAMPRGPLGSLPKDWAPQGSWRRKVPTELAQELIALRKKYDRRITEALQDTATMARFMRNPVDVLDGLGVPLSPKLRERLKGPSGIEKLQAPRQFRLPGNRVIAPQTSVRIQEEGAAPAPAAPRMLYLWSPFSQFFKPSGLETHGYPVVYEISKSRLRELLGQMLDKILPDLLIKLGLPDQAGEIPFLSIGMGMPAEVTDPVKRGYSDILDLTVTVGSATLRWAASVAADHSDPKCERFGMDLAKHIVYCAAKRTVKSPIGDSTYTVDVSPLFETLLKTMGWMPVFIDLPVNRSGSQPFALKQVDLRIIDDTSSADNDALALMFVFPGTSPGDPKAFTNSFARNEAGCMVDSRWLRDMILPSIETALGLPANSIDRDTGYWSGELPIAGADGTALTYLAIGVLNGTDSIAVLVGASKKGDCYTASASASASVKVAVENGVLTIPAPTIGPVTVDVSIPWYCYLLSILAGGVLGGLLLGAIGDLVGMVIAPILLHSTEEAIENTINNAMSKVTSTINDNFPDVNVNLGALKSVLTFAHIEDLMLLSTVYVVDTIPAQVEGTVFIPNGGCLSLLSGQVAPPTQSGMDLALVGTGANRFLSTLGGIAVGTVGVIPPECVTRFRLYHCGYSTNQQIPFSQVAAWNGTQYVALKQVYAARTADGHYAYFLVTGVRDDGLWVQYKTYPREYPKFQLAGDFGPEFVKRDDAAAKPAFTSLVGTGSSLWGRWSSLLSSSYYVAKGVFSWTEIGLKRPVTAVWKVQGQTLQEGSGTVDVDGVPFQYECYPQQLKLTMAPPDDIDVWVNVQIDVSVTDAAGREVSGSLTRTARAFHERAGESKMRVTPRLPDYIEAYKIHIGPWVEVDPEAPISQVARTERR